ncbi:unnamed protein product [Protopolystoma xenopodis]|uniref:Uncharacterized protein n=1 Tax=Protopolystoma xenopodis TaxID=117903 RepID=A0A448XGY2_9PLAT|nr:unnamed protein product [Protopolystoma xenopodis]
MLSGSIKDPTKLDFLCESSAMNPSAPFVTASTASSLSKSTVAGLQLSLFWNRIISNQLSLRLKELILIPSQTKFHIAAANQPFTSSCHLCADVVTPEYNPGPNKAVVSTHNKGSVTEEDISSISMKLSNEEEPFLSCVELSGTPLSELPLATLESASSDRIASNLSCQSPPVVSETVTDEMTSSLGIMSAGKPSLAEMEAMARYSASLRAELASDDSNSPSSSIISSSAYSSVFEQEEKGVYPELGDKPTSDSPDPVASHDTLDLSNTEVDLADTCVHSANVHQAGHLALTPPDASDDVTSLQDSQSKMNTKSCPSKIVLPVAEVGQSFHILPSSSPIHPTCPPQTSFQTSSKTSTDLKPSIFVNEVATTFAENSEKADKMDSVTRLSIENTSSVHSDRSRYTPYLQLRLNRTEQFTHVWLACLDAIWRFDGEHNFVANPRPMAEKFDSLLSTSSSSLSLYSNYSSRPFAGCVTSRNPHKFPSTHPSQTVIPGPHRLYLDLEAEVNLSFASSKSPVQPISTSKASRSNFHLSKPITLKNVSMPFGIQKQSADSAWPQNTLNPVGPVPFWLLHSMASHPCLEVRESVSSHV